MNVKPAIALFDWELQLPGHIAHMDIAARYTFISRFPEPMLPKMKENLGDLSGEKVCG